MIKLFSLKQEKAESDKAGAPVAKKIAPGLIRMQKGKPHLGPTESGLVCVVVCVCAKGICRWRSGTARC